MQYLDFRRNLIVPNVSWGMFYYECDLVSLTPAGYATEIEIKVSKADLKKDKEKRHNHDDWHFKYLYFAVPDYLEDCVAEHIPERAGIIIVSEKKSNYYGSYYTCKVIRKPRARQNPYCFTDKDRFKLARLGAIRIYGMKKAIKDRCQELKELKNELKQIKTV